MSIESIKAQVESEGYSSFYHRARLVVAIDSGTHSVTGEVSHELLCYVYVLGAKYVVEHYDGSLPVLEEFSSDSEVLSFIRELARIRNLDD